MKISQKMNNKTKHIFILILTFFVFQYSVQGQEYLPFPTDSATWHTLYSWPEMEPPYVSYFTTKYEVVGDTLINSEVYKKLYKSAPSGNINNPSYTGAYRVTTNKEVLYIEAGQENEILLYDFSLIPGDTIELENETILTCADTSTIYLNSNPHLSYSIILEQPTHTCYTTWVQGVGSLRTPLETASFCGISPEWAYDLTCFSYKNENIYEWEMNPYFSGCIGQNVIGTEDYSCDDLQIIPNPVTNNSKIIGCENDVKIVSYQILDITGHVIYEDDNTILTEIEIDEKGLDSGTYFLRVVFNHSKDVKIIKFLIL